MHDPKDLEALKSENNPDQVLLDYLVHISRQTDLNQRRKLAEHVLYYMQKFNLPATEPIFKEIGRLIESSAVDRLGKGLKSLVGMKKTTEDLSEQTIQKLFRFYQPGKWTLEALANRVKKNSGFDIHSTTDAVILGGGEGVAAPSSTVPEPVPPPAAVSAEEPTGAAAPTQAIPAVVTKPPAPSAPPGGAPKPPAPSGAPGGAPRPPGAPGGVPPRPHGAPGPTPRPPMPPSVTVGGLEPSTTAPLLAQMAKLRKTDGAERPKDDKPKNPMLEELERRAKGRDRSQEEVYEAIAKPKPEPEFKRTERAASARPSARGGGGSAGPGGQAPTLFKSGDSGNLLDELKRKQQERKERSEKSENKSPK